MEASEMSCLEFRRRTYAEPRALSPAAEAHRAQCPACRALWDEVAGLEARLQDAVEVPVPEGLAERVLLRYKLAPRQERRRWVAVVGGVLVLAALLRADGPHYKAPALAAIDHVLEEEPHELAIGRAGDPKSLAWALARSGLTLPQGGFQVRYLGRCPFRGGTAYHVLLATPFGKATLLLMPDRPLDSTMVAGEGGMSALAAPAPRGSYALVADSKANLLRIAALIQP